jgi:hypothetical protein
MKTTRKVSRGHCVTSGGGRTQQEPSVGSMMRLVVAWRGVACRVAAVGSARLGSARLGRGKSDSALVATLRSNNNRSAASKRTMQIDAEASSVLLPSLLACFVVVDVVVDFGRRPTVRPRRTTAGTKQEGPDCPVQQGSLTATLVRKDAASHRYVVRRQQAVGSRRRREDRSIDGRPSQRRRAARLPGEYPSS